MSPLLLSDGVLIRGIYLTKEQQEATSRQRFVPLPGNAEIRVEDARHLGGPMIRRYTPAYDPPPWQLHTAIDDEAVEHFMFHFHPEFVRKDVPEIRAFARRPIWAKASPGQQKQTEQPHAVLLPYSLYRNRWRYLHAEQDTDDVVARWFLITVRGVGLPELCFEHRALLDDLAARQPALPTPKRNALDEEHESAITLMALDLQHWRAHATHLMAQIAALRKEQEVPARTEAERTSLIHDIMAKVVKMQNDLNEQMQSLEAMPDVSQDAKAEIADILQDAFAKQLAQLRSAVEAKMAAPAPAVRAIRAEDGQ